MGMDAIVGMGSGVEWDMVWKCEMIWAWDVMGAWGVMAVVCWGMGDADDGHEKWACKECGMI